MSLTLAIPVHNDARPLARLLARAAQAQAFARIVVVDDGSDTPLEADALAAAAGLGADRLSLLRHDIAQGPGRARNHALAAVDTPWLMYLDADDLPTPEIAPLMADLAGQSFDFCLFQHHDTRAEQELRWGQMPWDQALWAAAGADLGALTQASPGAAAHLAGTANYPWNKIYRADFLRDHGIGCSDILVHEDVELHWKSFARARTILASDRIGVIHHVATAGDRLTNRRGPERLAVFPVLTRLAGEIAPNAALFRAFGRFSLALALWIRGNLAPEHHPALADAVAAFVSGALTDALRARLGAADPALMAEIEAMIGETSVS